MLLFLLRSFVTCVMGSTPMHSILFIVAHIVILCLVSPCFVPGVGAWHAIVSYPGNTHYHFEDNISSLINVQYLFPDHAKLIL